MYIHVHACMYFHEHLHTCLYHVQTRMYLLPILVQVVRIPDAPATQRRDVTWTDQRFEQWHGYPGPARAAPDTRPGTVTAQSTGHDRPSPTIRVRRRWTGVTIWNRDRMVHTGSYRQVCTMLGYRSHTPIYHHIPVHSFCRTGKYVLGLTFCLEYVLRLGTYFLPRVCTWYIQVHTRGKRYILEGKSTPFGLKLQTFPVIYQCVPVCTSTFFRT